MREIRYSDINPTFVHPGDLDGEPHRVAQEATGDLEASAGVFSKHVIAVVQQVRNGYMSEQLTNTPELTPARLAELWDASDEALACVRMMRTARAATAAVRQLQAAQKASL